MKAFLFDIGNVLVDFDFDRLPDVHAGPSLLPFSERDIQMRDAVEKGEISDTQWVEYLNDAKGLGWDVGDLVRVWQKLFTVNETGCQLLRDAVTSGAKVYTLSNIAQHHMDAIEINWNGFFDGVAGLFLSYRIGERKPHERIYRHALEELNLLPSDCFFIDDLPENVEAARSFGIQAHRFVPETHAAVRDAAGRFFDW